MKLHHALLIIAWLHVAACSLLLKYAKPEELAALPEATVVPLSKFAEERSRIAAEWQFAKREQAIAQTELTAILAKRGIAENLAEWADVEATAARNRRADERVALLGYCKNLYRALAELHAAERHLAKALVSAATARSREQQRLYELAEAQEERAKMAAVTDQPGVLKQDREKIMSRWNNEVARLEAAAQQALLARRQAEVRASDAQTALLGHTASFKNRFSSPCLIDWMLPEDGQPPPRRQVRNPSKTENISPLAMDEDNKDHARRRAASQRVAPASGLDPFADEVPQQAVPLDAAVEAPMLSEE